LICVRMDNTDGFHGNGHIEPSPLNIQSII
jgi:hypothetical protein